MESSNQNNILMRTEEPIKFNHRIYIIIQYKKKIFFLKQLIQRHLGYEITDIYSHHFIKHTG